MRIQGLLDLGCLVEYGTEPAITHRVVVAQHLLSIQHPRVHGEEAHRGKSYRHQHEHEQQTGRTRPRGRRARLLGTSQGALDGARGIVG